MTTKESKRSSLEAAREMWVLGVCTITLLFALSLIAVIVLKSDFTINFFGIEATRHGQNTSIQVGTNAMVGFLFVLPLLSAGLTYYRNRRLY